MDKFYYMTFALRLNGQQYFIHCTSQNKTPIEVLIEERNSEPDSSYVLVYSQEISYEEYLHLKEK